MFCLLLAAAVATSPPASCSVAWREGQLVIQSDRPLVMRQAKLTNPARHVIDLLGAELADPRTPGVMAAGESGVRQVRVARHPETQSLRVVLDLGDSGPVAAAAARAESEPDQGRTEIEPGQGRTEIEPDRGRAEIEPETSRGRHGPAAARSSETVSGHGPVLAGPPAPETPEGLVGPPVPVLREGTLGPPAPGTPEARIGPPAPPLPAEELAEHAATPSAPWPPVPQIVERMRIRRLASGDSVVEIRSRGPLMAWVVEDVQSNRLTIRVPRSSLACAAPRPRGAVRRVAIRREPEAWVLALDLAEERHVLDSASGDGGRTLAIRIRRAPPLAAARPLILVDPGHGGYDPGATGPTGKAESQVALGVAKDLLAALEDAGFQGVLTRTMDSELRLADRELLRDRYSPAAVISLHCNSGETSAATGIETYYRFEPGHALARSVHERLVVESGRPDRGVRTARLFMLRGEHLPAVLVEMGFLTNPEEEARLVDPAYQKVLAAAIAGGVKKWWAERIVAAGDDRAAAPL